MRTIKQSSQFKRDLKRERNSPHRSILTQHFTDIVKTLACDDPLAEKHRDHALIGNWQDHRDCHIKPDLILIYHQRINHGASVALLMNAYGHQSEAQTLDYLCIQPSEIQELYMGREL